MILQPKDFKKKLNENFAITHKAFHEIFEDILEDKKFMAQLNQGFTTYIIMDLKNDRINVCNIKPPEDEEEESILDKDNIVAVKAFDYLKEAVSH